MDGPYANMTKSYETIISYVKFEREAKLVEVKYHGAHELLMYKTYASHTHSHEIIESAFRVCVMSCAGRITVYTNTDEYE